ncbi:hypothetical protein TNCV_566071 [Trichonephila clavipes]|nr:hypothetical protein TNCV_566071 [Trichonephila clavipes]
MSFKRLSEMQYITTRSLSYEEKEIAYGYCKLVPLKFTPWLIQYKFLLSILVEKENANRTFLKKSKLPSEEAYKTFIEAIKEHNPDAPYLEDLTDGKETSSACETEHQEERHLPNLKELLRTKFSGILKYVRADESIHSLLLDC